MRVAHLSDLHIIQHGRRVRRLLSDVKEIKADLFFFTGDYMDHAGDEPVAMAALEKICSAVSPRFGSFGTFGNHDTDEMRERVTKLPITWLMNRSVFVGGGAIEVMGLDYNLEHEYDAVALMKGRAKPPSEQAASTARPLRLLLAHFPDFLTTAADMAVDVMFAGHTHGGQIRLPWLGGGRALINSSYLPLHLSSGVLRLRHTLGVVSRGLGETRLQMRMFCKPHVPVFTLKRGALEGDYGHRVINFRPW